MLGSPGRPRVALAQALANLARMTPGAHEGAVVRVGGNSADESCWLPRAGAQPVAPVGCSCSYNITSVDLDTYRSFAAEAARLGANVSFVLNTNLGCGSPKLGAAHIKAISDSGLWTLVHAVEIGNEIDKFPGSKRSSAWGTASPPSPPPLAENARKKSECILESLCASAQAIPTTLLNLRITSLPTNTLACRGAAFRGRSSATSFRRLTANCPTTHGSSRWTSLLCRITATVCTAAVLHYSLRPSHCPRATLPRRTTARHC